MARQHTPEFERGSWLHGLKGFLSRERRFRGKGQFANYNRLYVGVVIVAVIAVGVKFSDSTDRLSDVLRQT